MGVTRGVGRTEAVELLHEGKEIGAVGRSCLSLAAATETTGDQVSVGRVLSLGSQLGPEAGPVSSSLKPEALWAQSPLPSRAVTGSWADGESRCS